MSKASLYTIRHDILDIKYGINGNKLISFVHREIYANPGYVGLVERDGHRWLKISKGEMAKRTNMDKKTVKLLMRADKNKSAEVFIWEPFSSNKSHDNDIHIVRLNYGILHAISPSIYPEGGGGKNTLRRGKTPLEVGGESPDTHIYTITPSIIPSSLHSSTESKIKKKKPVKLSAKQAIPLALDELTPEDVMIKLDESECHPTNHIRLFESFLAYKKNKNATPKPLATWQAEIKRYCKKGNDELDMGWKNPQTQQHLSSVPDAQATRQQIENEHKECYA